MLKGIDVTQRIEFVSKEDDGDPKTIFVLKPLSGADMVDMADFSDGGNMKLSGKSIVDMLDKSIVEIKNYNDELGKREAIESLPAGVLGELVAEVGSFNNLTESDKKK